MIVAGAEAEPRSKRFFLPVLEKAVSSMMKRNDIWTRNSI